MSSSFLRLTDDFVNLCTLCEKLKIHSEWILGIGALSLQEVAVKKKLESLGISSFEDDFQKVAENLENKYLELGGEPPSILLSISRAYRHIRAKLLHEGHKYSVSEKEARTIVENTSTLIEELFKEETTDAKIHEIFSTLITLDKEEMEELVCHSSKEVIFGLIDLTFEEMKFIDSSEEMYNHEYLIDFLKKSIQISDTQIRLHLLTSIINHFSNKKVIFGHSSLLNMVESLTSLSYLKDKFRELGGIDMLLKTYENSGSFDSAKENTRRLLKYEDIMNEGELNKVIEIAIENNQIFWCWDAQKNLKGFIERYRSILNPEKIELLYEKFE